MPPLNVFRGTLAPVVPHLSEEVEFDESSVECNDHVVFQGNPLTLRIGIQHYRRQNGFALLCIKPRPFKCLSRLARG